MPPRWGRRAPELAAAAAGLALFLCLGGGAVIRPGNVAWMGAGDWASHLLGWLHFRNAAWALPLGRIDGELYPVGTTVGFTDSIPLLAIPLKLASPLLPGTFQYFGAWLALCFALQGWAGARLTAVLSDRPLHRALGGALFALAPPLAARAVLFRHPSLCATWLLVGLLALALAPAAAAPGPARRALGALGLVLLAAAIHPTLCALALGLALALLARSALEGALSWTRAAAWSAAVAALAAALLALLGYAGGTPSGAAGFGEFSADLLWPLNGFGASRLLPALPAGPGQYEGMGAPGLGALAAGAAGLALLAAQRRLRPAPGRLRALSPLLGVSLACAAFALATPITLAGRPLLSLDAIYARLGPLTGAFRASGRFVWPLSLLLTAGALAALLAALRDRPRLATAALAGAVALQAADLSALPARDLFPARAWRLASPAWEAARGVRHVAMLPPEIKNGGPSCNGDYAWDDYVPLSELAYRLGATFNSGWTARLDAGASEAACRALLAEALAGALRPDTLYVLHPRMRRHLPPGSARCGEVEGHTVCVAPGTAGPLATLAAAWTPFPDPSRLDGR
ncbi:DUF6311 domain-containing protein [Anaeromyxobacter paludicola]|uniref:Uncharacterized protein n=1 Tax=Anaeromyxobacter paludicola TaxID=2918171 RepID=A0ABM7XAQ1_9BACT|nr:DUF6311 domain-containing protein [Anaeromyxobacter paludicola]BDG08922.1 hypothetical protein AMPC_20350 [Anaeromyxobacter paludicola]